MEQYNKRKRVKLLIRIFPSLFICFLFLGLPAANAETAAEYIEQGENQFASLTVQGATDAYSTFETAHSQYPNDPVINIYLALTRFCYLGLTDDAGGLKDFLSDYDISIEGTDTDTLMFIKPENAEGDTILPETSPSGEAVRSFIDDSLITAINDSIANLDTAISNWTSTDKHIIAMEKFDTYADIEFDYGDIFLLRSALKSLKMFLLLITAYDLDVDIKDVVDLAQTDLFNIQDSLDTYGDFLRLLPTSTTSGVDGEAQLYDARAALLGAIDDYLAASGYIRNDPGTEAGAEEFFEITECEFLEEEYFRNNLQNLKDSLNNITVLEVVDEEETWLFTDGTTGDQLEVHLEENRSMGWIPFTGDCISGFCDGCIECVIIDGDQITLDLSNWTSDVTYTGTLSTDGTEITGGSYYGWVEGEYVSGTFSGEQTNIEQETDRIDLNPLFGNGSGPYDLRDFMPLFNEYDDPITGTIAHGLGDDPTLGGIVPDMTQDDWELGGITNTILVGTWGWENFGYSNGSWGTVRGNVTFYSNGKGSNTLFVYIPGSGTIPVVVHFTYSITTNEDGSITLWTKPEGNAEFMPSRRFLSDDGSMMIIDNTGNTAGQGLTVLIKIDREKIYSNADLSGEYYTIGYQHNGPSESSIASEAFSGIFDFDGSGGFNATEAVNGDGTIDTIQYSDMYSVNPDGSFVNYDIAGTGYLSGDGKIFISPNSDCDDCWGGYIGIKKQDRSYSTADLEGTWAIVGFEDYEGTNIRAMTGTSTCDSDGNCTFLMKIQRSDGIIEYTSVSETYSIASDGSFGSSITSNAPAYAGAIGNNGNTFIMNRSFDQSNLHVRDIVIGVRSSASQPNTPSNKATLSLPLNGATDVPLTPTLETGSFSDPDPGDTHANTQWQISEETDFSSTVLDVTSSSNLTTLTVPDLALVEGTTYYWRVRFYDNSLNASDWADAYSFTTITTTNDGNGNGIPDDKETEEDVDGDGTPDNQQEDIIKSMNTAVGDGQMGVSRRDDPTVTSIKSIDSIDPDTISRVLRPGSMALGLFAIKLNVANAGDSAEVTIYFSNPAPSDAKWYMYNSIDRWEDYSGYATFSDDRKSVVLRLQDGGYGDADGVANGVIVDPGGFGTASWIEGLVSDSYTGEAITTGQVTIEDFVLDTALGGHYITAILPGLYSVTASATGYTPKNYAAVEVSEGSMTTRDFVLSQSGGDLNIGWNLVSLSKQPYNTSISTVLSPIVNKYISVWAYVNGSWQVYDPENPGFSDLTTMEAGRGYWINMSSSAKLTISGSTPSKSMSLSSGWNLVGYDSETAQAVDVALESIYGNYISVWAYIDGAWKVYDPANPGFSDLLAMEPGYGYWINAKEACTWTLP